MLGPLLLLLTAALWGTAFVAQKFGAGHLGPFAVLFARGILASLFLAVWTRLAKGAGYTRGAVVGGALSGLALFLAELTQQIGIASASPGISAFLTTNYLLFVPAFGLFVGRRPPRLVWIFVVFALVGSFLLSVAPGEDFRIGRGEAWTILCAILFAVQILVVDRFAPGTDVLAFSCVSQVVATLLPVPFLFLPSETAHFVPADLVSAVLPILYLGFVSSGIAYTTQNLGQVRTPPTLASLIMSLESVFGAFAGYVFFGDVLSSRQLLGCAFLFVAAVATPLLTMNRKSANGV